MLKSPPMNTLDLTVIIPTYNRADILSQCLEALSEQTMPKEDFQIIVVDDGSTDNTKEIAKSWELKFPHFKYVHQENQGQGNARNNALKHALGKIVLFIGDDMIPEDSTLQEHMLTHKKHPELRVAVLGLVLWHPEIEETEFMKWLTNGKAGGTQFAYDLLEDRETADYNFFYTSNISLKKNILDKHKFDPDFKSYGWEDIELGYRLTKEENLKLYYNRRAVAYHHHTIDEKSLAERMRSIGRSSIIFHQKHPELKKIPSFWKRLALRLISCKPILAIAKSQNKNFYWYAMSKKYFLEGLKQV